MNSICGTNSHRLLPPRVLIRPPVTPLSEADVQFAGYGLKQVVIVHQYVITPLRKVWLHESSIGSLSSLGRYQSRRVMTPPPPFPWENMP